MSDVYKSLKVKMQDTWQWRKTNSRQLDQKKSTTALSLNDEMQGLERLLSDWVGKLKAAVTAGEAIVVEEARKAEQFAGGLKAQIAELNAKLKETEQTVERNDFSRRKMEETLTAKIKDLQHDLKKRDEALVTRANELNDYKSKIDAQVKQIGELGLANSKLKEEAATQAKHAENLAESSRVEITALESRLKETEELARHKDSAIIELEQKFAAEVKEFESVVKNNQDLLTRRDSEIKDLKVQLKRLTKGINEISSFFRQAEALTSVEEEDVTTASQNESIAKLEEKPAAVESNTAKVTPAISDSARDTVPAEIFQRIISELAQVTNIISPLASLIVHQQVKALGETVEKFPRTRFPELLEALAKEISDENRQMDFRQRLAQSAQISLN